MADIYTGIKRELGYVAEGDTLTVKSSQDIDPFLKRNQVLQNDTSLTRGKEMRYVASIPNITIEEWLKEGINIFNREHWPLVKKKLNDPAYKYLRTDLSTL